MKFAVLRDIIVVLASVAAISTFFLTYVIPKEKAQAAAEAVTEERRQFSDAVASQAQKAGLDTDEIEQQMQQGNYEAAAYLAIKGFGPQEQDQRTTIVLGQSMQLSPYKLPVGVLALDPTSARITINGQAQWVSAGSPTTFEGIGSECSVTLMSTQEESEDGQPPSADFLTMCTSKQ